MQHAKKMVLVPQEAISTRESLEQARTVQTPGNTLNRLDAEMDDILRSVTPSNQREKWKLYQQVLQRYQFFVDEERRPKITSVPANTEKPPEQIPEETAEKEEEVAGVPDAVILAAVPKTFKTQAEQLLKYIHSTPGSKLSWDKSGLVFINRKPVEGSNITDLVNEATRRRKTVRATGRDQFGAELRRMGIPRELIGNPSLLYENLSLDAAINANLSGLDASTASNVNQTFNTSLNSSADSNGSGRRRRIPTSELLNTSWKKLKL